MKVRVAGLKVKRAIILVLVLGGWRLAAAAPPQCTLQLPVFDAVGNQLQFRIIAVRLDSPDSAEGPDLLHNTDPKRRITVDGETLYFPKNLMRTPLRVTLQGPGGAMAYGRVGLMDCQQRQSLRSGEHDSGVDASFYTISGRLSGCEFSSDWWIRAIPMFGDTESSPTYEGRIDRDGSFAIRGNMPGVRHMFVIGKGNQPVKVFAFDVTRAGINDTGDIDLGGGCRKDVASARHGGKPSSHSR